MHMDSKKEKNEFLGLGAKTLGKVDIWKANPSTCVTILFTALTSQVKKTTTKKTACNTVKRARGKPLEYS